jgi:hypothetical protein
MRKRKPTKIKTRKPTLSRQRRPARLKQLIDAAHRQYGRVFRHLAES